MLFFLVFFWQGGFQFFNLIICNTLTSQVDAPDRLMTLFMEVKTELYRKANELRLGIPSSLAVLSLESLSYTMPTCPGSSGAKIWAFKTCEDGFREFGGSHSRGAGSTGNLCGFGAARLQPVRNVDGQLVCVAERDYVPEMRDELALTRGDKVRVIHKEDNYWWWGEVGERVRNVNWTVLQSSAIDVLAQSSAKVI